MITTVIVIPLLVLGVLGLVMGIGLGLASLKFAIQVDPKVEELQAILPGANCAACGFAGCLQYAKALAEGKAKPTACPVGGEEGAKRIAQILGLEVGIVERKKARVFCGGDTTEARQKGIYEGMATCKAASFVAGGGTIQCNYGCLGFGDCIRACPFGAMVARRGMPPFVADEKCTSCGLCVNACPKNLIKLVPEGMDYVIACSSFDKGKITRRVCDVGCTACNVCVKKCPQRAITIEDNLARINYELCKNTGECSRSCPRRCIQKGQERFARPQRPAKEAKGAEPGVAAQEQSVQLS